MSERPLVTIELKGPTPPSGYQWCAICALLYLGEVSSDEETQNKARMLVQAAIDEGEGEVIMPLPKSWRILRVAVTTAPTVHFPNVPMPTCWIHLQGMSPETTPTDVITLEVNKNGKVLPRRNSGRLGN